MNAKQQFLTEHNSLSPSNLQATMKTLNLFEKEKPLLFKDGNYSVEKIRRPFIFWLTSLNRKND